MYQRSLIMFRVITLIFALGSSLCLGKENKIPSQLMIQTHKGFGKVMIRIDEYGEPVSKPQKLSLAVSCGRNLNYQYVLQDFGVCEVEKIELNQKTKVLTVHQKEYNPDNGKCEKKSLYPVAIKAGICQ